MISMLLAKIFMLPELLLINTAVHAYILYNIKMYTKLKNK